MEEDVLQTAPIFGRLSQGVSNEALMQEAKKRKKEKYGVAGKAIGGLAGGVGAILTGNPALISMGMSAGEQIGSLAGGGLKEMTSGKSSMNAGEATKIYDQAMKIKDKYNADNPDWGNMDADQISKLLEKRPELKENYFSFLDALSAENGGMDNLAEKGLEILSSPQGAEAVAGAL